MAVVITGNNTPTAGGVVYGDGTTYATTTAGTSGRPIVSGGAGAPTFRPYTLPAADGSANQVLQTNGSGALSFATPSAGALVLLATVDATSASYATFDGYFTSTYDNYLVVASDFVDSGGGGTMNAQVAIASTYQTGAFYRTSAIVSSSTATTVTGYAQTTASNIQMVQVNALTFTTGLYCYIYCPLSTTGPKVISFNVVGQRYASNSIQQIMGVGSWGDSNAALSGIRFASQNGTWYSGKFRLYGLANT
jgi:hypothetical protein